MIEHGALRNAAIIFNPRAGGGAGREEHLSAVINRLETVHRWKVHREHTTRPNHATELARELSRAEEGYEVIIAAGGDGTLNETLQGMDSERTLGCLPLGTVNVWSREAGIPRHNPLKAADALATGRTYPIDTLILTADTHTREALLMTELGLSAESFRRAQEEGKRGITAILKKTAQIIAEGRPAIKTTITVGEETLTVDLVQLLVQNTRGYGWFHLGKGFADDGICEVSIGSGKNSREFVLPALNFLRSPGKDHRGIIFKKTDKPVTITTAEPIDYHADGDPLGQATTFRIETNQHSRRVLVANKPLPIFH